MELEPSERSTREVRGQLADILNDIIVHGRVTYVTSHGRRIAAIVPLSVADRAAGPSQQETS